MQRRPPPLVMMIDAYKQKLFLQMNAKCTFFSFHRNESQNANQQNEQSQTDPMVQAKQKLIMSEYRLLQHSQPNCVPTQLDQVQMDYLMSLTQTKRYRRLTWLDYSYKLREEAMQRLATVEHFDGKHSLVLPFVGSENTKLIQRLYASMVPFLPNLVFDISFDHVMSGLECKNLAEQLIRIIHTNQNYFEGANKEQLVKQLFNLHLTNLESSQMTRQYLKRLLNQTGGEQYYPTVFFHEKSLLDVFPREQLVYLSPHAKETMKEYRSDLVYIIGGIVDRREIIELTSEKCTKLRITCQKLPIEQMVRKQVQSLWDVFLLLRQFLNTSDVAHFAQDEQISQIVNKHVKRKIKDI